MGGASRGRNPEMVGQRPSRRISHIAFPFGGDLETARPRGACQYVYDEVSVESFSENRLHLEVGQVGRVLTYTVRGLMTVESFVEAVTPHRRRSLCREPQTLGLSVGGCSHFVDRGFYLGEGHQRSVQRRAVRGRLRGQSRGQFHEARDLSTGSQ